jgi:hypothetical protein
VGGAVTFGALGLFLSPTRLAAGYELIGVWNTVESSDDGQLGVTE